MDLIVQRHTLKADRTLGELMLGDIHFAYTLEDQVREEQLPDGTWSWGTRLKVPGETAIPSGRYEVVVTWSHRFGTRLPLLLDVPDFEGIRMHGANGPQDLQGCIGVGKQQDGSRIWNCGPIMSELTERIRRATLNGKAFIDVRNP